MMKTVKILGLTMVVVLGMAVSVLGLNWYLQKRSYESSYSQIRVGDSKQKVIELYGQPAEVTDCSLYKRPSYIEALQKDCVEIYWYRALLEQWAFFFDKDGKVVHKAFNTTP